MAKIWLEMVAKQSFMSRKFNAPPSINIAVNVLLHFGLIDDNVNTSDGYSIISFYLHKLFCLSLHTYLSQLFEHCNTLYLAL